MGNEQVPRIGLLQDDAIPETFRGHVHPGRGEEVYRAWANFPPVLVWMQEMYAALASHNPTGARRKEMLRLRVASLNDCKL